MPVEAPPYATVVTVQALFLFGYNDITDFLTNYNPITGEYTGTPERVAASKTRTVQVGAQTTFGMWADIACYPLSVFASYITPLEP